MPRPAEYEKNADVVVEKRKNNRKSSVCLIFWQTFFYVNIVQWGNL